jgi:hypothetical protein
MRSWQAPAPDFGPRSPIPTAARQHVQWRSLGALWAALGRRPGHPPLEYPSLVNAPADRPEPAPINLKDPYLAAFLAWLWPGLGHLYQGRRAKGVLFMIAILSTFFFGFFLGEGRVVYASWNPDFRWPYVCQVCVGLPALPAVVEARRANNARAYLRSQGLLREEQTRHTSLFNNRWFVPPLRDDPQTAGEEPDELDALYYSLNRFFELGTLYTMVAGLLNVLAIYDAFAGPALARAKEEKEQAARSRGEPAGAEKK